MKKLATLIVKLTTDEHKMLKIEAAERNITMSTLVKQALVLYLKTYNKEK